MTELEPRENGALSAQPDQLGAGLGVGAGMDGVIDQEVFESIYHRGKLLLLAGWRDAEAATAWPPIKPDPAAWLRHRHVRVIRDYGMFDRREATQFYPAVNRPAPRRRIAIATTWPCSFAGHASRLSRASALSPQLTRACRDKPGRLETRGVASSPAFTFGRHASPRPEGVELSGPHAD